MSYPRKIQRVLTLDKIDFTQEYRSGGGVDAKLTAIAIEMVADAYLITRLLEHTTPRIDLPDAPTWKDRVWIASPMHVPRLLKDGYIPVLTSFDLRLGDSVLGVEYDPECVGLVEYTVTERPVTNDPFGATHRCVANFTFRGLSTNDCPSLSFHTSCLSGDH